MKHETRTFEIKIEKTETLVVRRRRRSIFAYCAECGREVVMFSPEEAALVGGIGQRNLFREIEAGRIHFVEPTEGLLLICSDSLLSGKQSLIRHRK